MTALGAAVTVAGCAVALLRTDAAFARTLAVAHGPDIEFAHSLRIISEGESESLAVLMIGLWTSALLCVVAGWPRAAGDAEKPPRLAIAAVAVLAIAAEGALRFRLVEQSWVEDAPLLVLVVVAGIAALRVARADRASAWRAVVALASAAVLCAMAARIGQRRLGLDAISGESVDPEQKLRILGMMLHMERSRALVFAIDVLAVVAAPLFALRRAGHRLDAEDSRAHGPLVAALALLAGAATWQRASFDAPFAAVGVAWDRFAPSVGVALPVVPSEEASRAGLHHALGGPALYVKGSGELLASPATAASARTYAPALWDELARPSADADVAAAPLLAADASLPLEALLGALAPLTARRQTQFHLLLTPRPLDPSGLGPYRGLVGSTELAALDVELAPSLFMIPPHKDPPGSARVRSLGLVVEGDHARAVLLQGKRGVYAIAPEAEPLTLPLGATAADRATRARLLAGAGTVHEIVLACAPATPLGSLVGLMMELSTPERRPFVITPDVASLTLR